MTNYQSHYKAVSILQTGIEQHFRKIYAENSAEWPVFNEYLEKHLLFITTTYSPRSGGDVNGTHQHLYEFGGYYYRLCKFIMGKSLGRKLKYQPVTYAFRDFEGSKSQGSAQAKSNDFPHVHALMLTHPDYRDEFAFYASCPAFCTKNMDDLIVKRFAPLPNEAEVQTEQGPQLPSLQNLISYSMKGFAKANPSDADTEYHRQEFPRHAFKTTWVRRDSPGSKVCGLQAQRADHTYSATRNLVCSV